MKRKLNWKSWWQSQLSIFCNTLPLPLLQSLLLPLVTFFIGLSLTCTDAGENNSALYKNLHKVMEWKKKAWYVNTYFEIHWFTSTWIEPFGGTRTTPSNLQEPSWVTGTMCDTGEQGNLLSVPGHMKSLCDLWQFDYPEKCHGQSSCLLGFAGGSEAVTVGNPDDRHEATAGFYKYLHQQPILCMVAHS